MAPQAHGGGGGTHHSQVVVHRLEGAAQQLAGLWISDLTDAAAVLRVPDAESPVQRRRHNDVVAQRPGEVCDGAAVTFQGDLHSGRRRGQRHDGQGAVQRAAGQQVLVIVGKLQPRNWWGKAGGKAKYGRHLPVWEQAGFHTTVQGAICGPLSFVIPNYITRKSLKNCTLSTFPVFQ